MTEDYMTIVDCPICYTQFVIIHNFWICPMCDNNCNEIK